jgi:hypothetical protein
MENEFQELAKAAYIAWLDDPRSGTEDQIEVFGKIAQKLIQNGVSLFEETISE